MIFQLVMNHDWTLKGYLGLLIKDYWEGTPLLNPLDPVPGPRLHSFLQQKRASNGEQTGSKPGANFIHGKGMEKVVTCIH